MMYSINELRKMMFKKVMYQENPDVRWKNYGTLIGFDVNNKFSYMIDTGTEIKYCIEIMKLSFDEEIRFVLFSPVKGISSKGKVVKGELIGYNRDSLNGKFLVREDSEIYYLDKVEDLEGYTYG